MSKIDLSTITGLSSSARETMWCLFMHGPTWDGDIPSKAGRGELFKLGLADRHEGWSFLTRAGMGFAIDRLLMHERKEKETNRRRAV